MSLSPEQFARLHRVLHQAFDADSLRRLARFALNEDLDDLTKEADKTQRAFDLIEAVERQHKTVELIAGIYNQNPGNYDVQDLIADAQTWPMSVERGLTTYAGQVYVMARREEEREYLDGLIKKHAGYVEKFTPPAGVFETTAPSPLEADLENERVPQSFARLLEMNMGPERKVEETAVADVCAAAASQKRLLLLGAPGCGKTAVLKRLACDYALAANSDSAAPIPFYVPLDGYGTAQSLLDYAAKCAGDTLGPQIPAYLHAGRAVLLLDALNEMPRDAYAEGTRRIQALLDAFPPARIAAACRTRDYTAALKLDKLKIAPLDLLRQYQYLCSYLGPQDGEKLFWEMAGPEAAALWAAWKENGATFEQFWTAAEPPASVGWSELDDRRRLWLSLRGEKLPPLLALGTNALLLRAITYLYNSAEPLPQNRALLIRAFVELLLAQESSKHEQDGWPGTDALRDGLADLAFAMQSAGQSGAAVTAEWVREQLSGAAGTALEYGQSAALLDAAGGQVRFANRLYQEYFAALRLGKELAQGADLHKLWPNGWSTPSGWEETAVLLAGILPDMQPYIESLAEVHPLLAARCAVQKGAKLPNAASLDKVKKALVEIIGGEAAPVAERSAAANALNLVGDPRPGTGLRGDGLPDIAWCDVPAGEFLMGSVEKAAAEYDPLAAKNEMPQHVVNVGPFSISRYPITNAQYQAFVDDGGYTEKWQECWTPEGWQQIQGAKGPRTGEGSLGLRNHPAIYISWHEAQAFCRWLSRKSGAAVALPTEAQWEKAARGVDGRRYPWGADLIPDHANYERTHLEGTSAAGIFPKGASPCGAQDMAANVWEWTSSLPGAYPYDAADGREDPASAEPRAMRGGSFRTDGGRIRCAAREKSTPDHRSRAVGFRIVRL